MAFSPDDVTAMLLSWARALPVVTLVPAFGLKALPVPARGVLALALAASVFPAVHHDLAQRSEPWMLLAFEQILIGLPIALAAAIPLWAATMAGGLVDTLRGAPEGPGLVIVEGRASSFGILFSLFAGAAFLSLGGASRVAEALIRPPASEHPLLVAMHDLTAGIGIAVGIGGPLLAAAIVLEVAFALVARAASPAQVQALLAPLRALGVLTVAALVFDRIGTLLAISQR